MASRKPLSATLNLSAKKMAFIRGETQAVTAEPASLSETSSAPQLVPVAQEQSIEKKPPPRQPDNRASGRHLLPEKDDSIVWIPNLLVPLTTRLQRPTAEALKRAAVEHKLRGRSPGTVQEIVEEALQMWLRESGFLV